MKEKDIIQQAYKNITARRELAQATAVSNYQKCMKLEGFSACYSKLNTLIPKIAEKRALGLDYSHLSGSYEKIKNELDLILSKVNLKYKHLYPIYTCSICEDAGYVKGNMCSCLKAEAVKLRDQAISAEFSGFPTLDNLSLDIYPKQHLNSYVELISKFKRARDKFPDIKQNYIVFCGIAGTGKTYLANAFVADLRKKGFDTLSMSSFSLNELFLQYHINFKNDMVVNLGFIMSTPVLFIDDLGQEPMRSNISNEYLLTLLNERKAKGKLTIISTNLNSDNIASLYSNAIASRLFDKNSSLVINFDFEDLRLRKFTSQ